MTETKPEVHRQNYPRQDLSDRLTLLKDFWAEFSSARYGLVGLGLIILFILIVVFAPYLSDFPEAETRWRDLSYWDTNPQSVPPIWVNWFSGKDRALQKVLADPEITKQQLSSMQITESTFIYNYDYEIAPSDIILLAKTKGMVNLELSVERPDGEIVNLLINNSKTTQFGDIKKSIRTDSKFNIYDFARRFDEEIDVSKRLLDTSGILFGKAQKGIVEDPESLKGEYRFRVKAATIGTNSEIKDVKIIICGSVFGLLGTDTSRRDIWSGVVAGTKWAMFIGLFVSFISVVIGVFYGITSAYLGGWGDSIMMRIHEIFAGIPRIPVMIIITTIIEPSIWVLIIVFCVFGWRAPVRTVRSMGLQIKAETYVEAARALGASNLRIIGRHMVPQMIPYAFATMALAVPGNVVAEASMSLIGLGDSTIATWGQILRGAFESGAVLNGYWWWIIPPGLIISVMGMSFAFIGYAMDNIMNPKLKTR